MLARTGRSTSANLFLASIRCASSGGKNVAQGDTLIPSSAKEAGNATKGKELAKAENLEYVTIQVGAQAFEGDLRSTSGLGLGDGLYTHTEKWDQSSNKSPMEYILAAKPIKVHGAVVASYGSENPALGCPVEYISLKGTSKEHPAVCKYTGNKYYSDDWHLAH
jgi:NADH dehydrogenase (ubiquinone) Fe-S protein 6